MNLIGVRVIHKTYGNGIIEKQDEKSIWVRCNSDDSIHKFTFPAAFDNGYLKFENESDWDRFYNRYHKKYVPAPSVKTMHSNAKEEKAGDKWVHISTPQEKKYPIKAPRPAEQPSVQAPMPIEPDVDMTAESAKGKNVYYAEKRPDSVTGLYSFTRYYAPESAIIKVKLTDKKNKDIIIVIANDIEEQNTYKGIFWVGRTLAKDILKAVFKNENEVVSKNEKYSLNVIEKYPEYSMIEAGYKYYAGSSVRHKLYIFQQKGIYDKKADGYELVTAMLYFPERDEVYGVEVYYNIVSNYYFMNIDSFESVVNKYGLPNVIPEFIDSKDNGTGWAKAFNTRSKLHRLGYHVGESSNLSETERRGLLRNLIETGKISELEVVNHLEMLIHLNRNKPSMAYACECWKSDLLYLNHVLDHRIVDFSEEWEEGAPYIKEKTEREPKIKKQIVHKANHSNTPKENNSSDNVTAIYEYDRTIDEHIDSRKGYASFNPTNDVNNKTTSTAGANSPLLWVVLGIAVFLWLLCKVI